MAKQSTRKKPTRQQQIAKLIAAGKSRLTIASKLGISPETVRTHIRRFRAS